MSSGTDKQYNVSREEKARVLRRAQMREALKMEFRKKVTNPHAYAKADSGYIFDATEQRYLSMRATALEQFKPTIKSFTGFFLVIVLPFIGIFSAFYNQRKSTERKYRNGEIAYKDRMFKFC